MTILKNKNSWNNYKKKYNRKFESFGDPIWINEPSEFPCIVLSYSLNQNLGYTVNNFFIYKKMAKELLAL